MKKIRRIIVDGMGFFGGPKTYGAPDFSSISPSSSPISPFYRGEDVREVDGEIYVDNYKVNREKIIAIEYEEGEL